MIGDYRNLNYLEIQFSSSTIQLSKDSIVAVVKVDSKKENVLIEFGPSVSSWEPVELLSRFEKLD